MDHASAKSWYLNLADKRGGRSMIELFYQLRGSGCGAGTVAIMLMLLEAVHDNWCTGMFWNMVMRSTWYVCLVRDQPIYNLFSAMGFHGM